METIVQRSYKGIIGSDRPTNVKNDRSKQSFNDCDKGLVGNDRSTILKRDRWQRSINDLKRDR